MEPIRKTAALLLVLAIAFLSACGGSEPPRRAEKAEQNSAAAGSELATQASSPEHAEPEESPDAAGEPWETLPPEGELAEWLGWDKATLESYLRHKLSYAFICAGYFDSENRSDVIKFVAQYTLNALPYSVNENGVIELEAGDAPNVLHIDTDLRAAGRPDQPSEEEIKAWLCQGEDAWFDACADWEDENHAYSYCNSVSFAEDGTCELYACVRASDITDEGKGTYTISGDRLTIRVTSLLGMEGDLEDENVAFVWHPADATYEYQLIPTATGFALVQTSANGFWYPGEVGEAMAWQKGYPEATAYVAEAPQFTPKNRWSDAEIEKVCEQIAEHYKELWQPQGDYVCYADEMDFDGSQYTFILRYCMSDEEVEERFQNGGFPEPNIYVMEVYVDAATGTVTDELEKDNWKIFLL